MSWSAKQYVAFEDERTRPVRDLLGALPPIEARVAIDLGCGPGNSTEVLAARYPQARVAGIDSSAGHDRGGAPALAATRLCGSGPDCLDNAGPFDVILANAVLQWVPDHQRVLPSLMARLTANGALAVQMPDNLDEPAHRLMREVAADGPWAAKLAESSAARPALASPAWYYELLRPLGAKVDLWRTVYFHSLSGGAAAVVEWFKGSGLRPFLEPLDAAERSVYLGRYTDAIAQAYPPLADGSVLLPFPRLFLTAVR